MNAITSSLIAGFFFGAGLVMSGMTQPTKVIGFLDFFGKWDPTLAFVIAGAVGVHAFGYWFMKKRSKPFFTQFFQLPTVQSIDAKLVIGSVLFGVGWGLSGYCPGPAFASLVGFNGGVYVFVGFMLLGMFIESKLGRKK